MKGYFFLGSILPCLQLGAVIDMAFDDLMVLYRSNLQARDWKQVRAIRKYIDVKNVCQLLKQEPLDVRGNFTEKELNEALVNEEGLPRYLYDHLEEYGKVQDQIRFFPKVLALFFQEAEEKYRGFLHFYFDFERKYRLVLVGLRAKKLGVDVIKELQYEDPKEPFIAQILAQKDSPSFAFPSEFSELGEILKESDNQDPMQQYKTMATYRYEHIAEEIQDHPFSLDYILGYLIQFMLAEDWSSLDEELGHERLNTVVKEVG